MESIPTVFGVLSHQVPVALQTLAACVLLMLGLSWAVRRQLADGDGVVPPERLSIRNFCEILFEGVVSLMRDTIGPSWPRYVPLIGTLGFFILVSNLMRQLPGFDGPTGYVETNLSWALMAFGVSEYAAFRQQGARVYLSHLCGPVWWLAPLMLPVEIISHGVRMMSLTIRLTGNMFADHTLIAVFLSFPTFVALFVPWIFMGLGIFVAFLQAFIFTFLTIIYIGQALEDAHH